MSLFTEGYWGVVLCGLTLLIALGSLLYLSRRAISRDECYHCRREMGFKFEEELIDSSQPDVDIYRRYRICQTCGVQTQMKEIAKPKNSHKE